MPELASLICCYSKEPKKHQRNIVSLQDDKFKMFLLLIKDVTDLSKAKAQQFQS